MDELATGGAEKLFLIWEGFCCHFMLAQIGKQCKPVQVHDFCKSACWGNIPTPLRTSSCDDGCSLILSVSENATSGQFGQQLF